MTHKKSWRPSLHRNCWNLLKTLLRMIVEVSHRMLDTLGHGFCCLN